MALPLVAGLRREFSLRKEPSASSIQVQLFLGSTNRNCGKEKGMESPTNPFPRERSDFQSDPADTGQSVPLVYWIGPQHALVDVLELSDGLSLCTSICHQQGLLTGECMSLQGRFSQPSYYATAWNAALATSPTFLYIEPPRIE